MQGRDMLATHRADLHLPQFWKDVVVERPLVDPRGICIAMHAHMSAHVAFRQTGHGECRFPEVRQQDLRRV